MNPVLLLTRNCLELTKRCVESVRGQDIPTVTLVIDNGSTDGTVEWLTESYTYPYEEFYSSIEERNTGVSAGWNWGLEHFFENRVGDSEYVLVVGNDTILPRYCYSALLSANVPFVSGVDVGMSQLPEKPDVFPLSPHPDFSCFLIRRECWEKVGRFDERMKLYSSDQDYHIRAHFAGVQLYKASVPYNHQRSSTMNRATPQERHIIAQQANADRAELKRKWGVSAGGPDYQALFSPELFGSRREPCG